MKKILTISLAAVFLIGCTQQRVDAPVNAKSITKADAKKVKSSHNDKAEALDINLKQPKSADAVNTSNAVESSSGGFESSPILKMVGSALLTGIISGLVSKALN